MVIRSASHFRNTMFMASVSVIKGNYSEDRKESDGKGHREVPGFF